jgi:hypothetical protein
MQFDNCAISTSQAANDAFHSLETEAEFSEPGAD